MVLLLSSSPFSSSFDACVFWHVFLNSFFHQKILSVFFSCRLLSSFYLRSQAQPSIWYSISNESFHLLPIISQKHKCVQKRKKNCHVLQWMPTRIKWSSRGRKVKRVQFQVSFISVLTEILFNNWRVTYACSTMWVLRCLCPTVISPSPAWLAQAFKFMQAGNPS